LNASGTVSPGNSIGTLHVAGDATFAPGSTLLVEALPDGNADQLDVTGDATINGGDVQVLALDNQPGHWAPNTTYTIVKTGGTRSGTFDSVSDNLAFLDTSLGYPGSNVLLTLSRNSADYTD